MTRRPEPSEYGEPFGVYVARIPETDILPVLRSQLAEVGELLDAISEERSTFRYAPGKWSIREVAGHLADSERIFSYRAMTFARGHAADLPGFDQDPYVVEGAFDRIPLKEIADEFHALRTANVLMLQHLRPDDWSRGGIANGYAMTVRAFAYVMAGHVRHHLDILKVRYLPA